MTSILASHGSVILPRRPECWIISAMAPVIRTRLGSRWAILISCPALACPRFCVAAVRDRATPRSRDRAGSSPSVVQAPPRRSARFPRSSPDAPSLRSPSLSPGARGRRSSPSDLPEQQPAQLGDRFRQATVPLLQHPGQLPEPGPALRGDHAVLGQVTPKRIDRLRALAHPQVTGAKKHPLCVLRLSFDRDGMHGWPLGRFGDRLCVRLVVLVHNDQRRHVDRRNRPHFVTERLSPHRSVQASAVTPGGLPGRRALVEPNGPDTGARGIFAS